MLSVRSVLLVVVLCHVQAWAAQPATKRVLFIGIDGVRTDALLAAEAPHLKALIREGTMADNTSVLGTRTTGADTVSGPGWSALLTGVWADKHGAKDNKFAGVNYQEYPHFFQRLKQVRPQAVTISVATWPPIHEQITSAADVSLSLLESDKDYASGDGRVASAAARLLKERDPDAMFVYFGNVDETGHKVGFHPSVKPYMQALEQVDQHVGTVMAAVRSRSRYAEEDWLVLVSTDHGGRGTGHGGGHLFDDVRRVFLIVSGPSAMRGKLEGPTGLVDVPATALTHLGIPLNPAWKLDGQAVGLKTR